ILKNSNVDIDGYTHNLNKKFGYNGIFEFNMAGVRYIMISRAEYVDRFMLPDQDNPSTWMFKFSFDFLFGVLIGSPSFAMKSYYQRLKNIDITKEIIEYEKYSNCVRNFQSDNLFVFMPNYLRNVPIIKDQIQNL
ncbi:9358_t:CDS:2, partial [Gigaspora rosea]